MKCLRCDGTGTEQGDVTHDYEVIQCPRCNGLGEESK